MHSAFKLAGILTPSCTLAVYDISYPLLAVIDLLLAVVDLLLAGIDVLLAVIDLLLAGIDLSQDRAFNDRRYYIGSSKLQGLGWTERTTWEEGLRKTIKW